MVTNEKWIPPPVEAFLKYLIEKRHLSLYTERAYRVDLCQWTEFLQGELFTIDQEVEQAAWQCCLRQGGMQASAAGACPVVPGNKPRTVTAALCVSDVARICNFLKQLKELNDYSPATMARKITTLRSFHKWLHKQGAIASNPMELIRTPRQNKRLPKAISVFQAKKLLKAPDAPDLLGARDKALLEVLYGTGIRVSELVDLNRKDVELDPIQAHIAVRGRGSHERLVPLETRTSAALVTYLVLLNKYQRARGNCIDPEDPVFINKNGGRLSTRGVRRSVSKYRAKAGLGADISARTLRHSFATHLLADGTNPSEVGELLGHQSTTSIRAYPSMNPRRTG